MSVDDGVSHVALRSDHEVRGVQLSCNESPLYVPPGQPRNRRPTDNRKIAAIEVTTSSRMRCQSRIANRESRIASDCQNCGCTALETDKELVRQETKSEAWTG